jgi:hypothetical protein
VSSWMQAQQLTYGIANELGIAIVTGPGFHLQT